MESYLTFWQTERVTKMQSAIHVRVGEGNKVLVFARRKTMQLKLYLAKVHKKDKNIGI